MNKTMKAKKAIGRRSLLKLDFATGVVSVVSIVIPILLFTSLSVQGTPTVITTLTFSGTINGEDVSYEGLVVMDVASEHVVSDIWDMSLAEWMCTIRHLTKQTRK